MCKIEILEKKVEHLIKDLSNLSRKYYTPDDIIDDLYSSPKDKSICHNKTCDCHKIKKIMTRDDMMNILKEVNDKLSQVSESLMFELEFSKK